MVTHICNSSTTWAEAGQLLWVLGHLWLHTKFQTSLGYSVRLCFKNLITSLKNNYREIFSCICISIYIYIFMYIRNRSNIHIYAYTHTCVYIDTYMYIHMCIYDSVFIHTCIFLIYIYMYTYAFFLMCGVCFCVCSITRVLPKLGLGCFFIP